MRSANKHPNFVSEILLLGKKATRREPCLKKKEEEEEEEEEEEVIQIQNTWIGLEHAYTQIWPTSRFCSFEYRAETMYRLNYGFRGFRNRILKFEVNSGCSRHEVPV